MGRSENRTSPGRADSAILAPCLFAESLVSAPAKRPAEHLSAFGLLLLAALALGWGLNWPVMKVVLSEVPPLSFRGFCLTLGGLGVLGLTRLGGGSVAVPAGCWKPLGWLALTNIVGWNALAIYGVPFCPRDGRPCSATRCRCGACCSRYAGSANPSPAAVWWPWLWA